MEREQDLLIDTIKSLITVKHNVVVIEIGAGTGRSLFSCRQDVRLMNKCLYFIGIDNAETMTHIAMIKRNQLRDSQEISYNDSKKFVFLTLDGENLNRYFYSGRIKRPESRIDRKNLIALNRLNDELYSSATKIICILLNTLGNISPSNRVRVLEAMVKAIPPGGMIILSLFDGSSFQQGALGLYQSIAPMVGKVVQNDFYYDTYELKAKEYYSHWFIPQEAAELVQSVGFQDVEIIPFNGSELKGIFLKAYKANQP